MFGFNFFRELQEEERFDRAQHLRDTSDGSLTREKIREIKDKAESCHICQDPLGDDRTLDHIQAAKNKGPHTSDNVDVAHQICNSRKGSKEWYLFPRRLRPDEQ